MNIEEEKGGKVKGLEKLMQHTHLGYEVPRYETIPMSYYDEIGKRMEIANIVARLEWYLEGFWSNISPGITRLPEQFDVLLNDLAKKYDGKDIIVRSNSLQEDSKHSFAGRYESFVVKHANKDNITAAIINVYNSINSDKARQYRHEHNIKQDKMGIIIQEFIEPKYSGVIYTSNPSYKQDLTIEFSEGRFEESRSRDRYIIDYNKKTGKRVFESENYHESADYPDMDFLIGIGKNIEKHLGPTDIEFIIDKNDKLYLVQSRMITDIKKHKKIVIPKYPEEQFVASTNISRGIGKVTLPVIKWKKYSSIGLKNTSVAFSHKIVTDEEVYDMEKSYFKSIRALDSKYKDGYILIIPSFEDSVLVERNNSVAKDIRSSTDLLTPNKKAIITTRSNSISSHAITAAREKNILYLGFLISDDDEVNDPFEDLLNGDILSIYATGREASIYKEKTPPKRLNEMFPDRNIQITFGYDTPQFSIDDSINSYKFIWSDVESFLKSEVDPNWESKDLEYMDMDRLYVHSKNHEAFVIRGSRFIGKNYMWSFSRNLSKERYGVKKIITKSKLDKIVNKYIEDIQKKQ